MRKLLLLIGLGLFCISLCSCNTTKKTNKVITCSDVIEAYEEAGFYVFHKDTDEQSYDWECYIKAQKSEDDSDYIMIHFFETYEGAVKYSETRQWNVVVWLYSLTCFQPTWVTTKVYNNMEIEYRSSAYYEPLKKLL